MRDISSCLSLLAQQAPELSCRLSIDAPTMLWIALALAVVALLAGWLMVKRVFRRQAEEAAVEPSLRLDVAELPCEGPPRGKPYLEFYSVPTRLAVVVIAPVGREGRLPTNEQLPQVMEAILPNLMKTLAAHQPRFTRWPAQLSTQGFAHAFFNNVPLPGEHGRGTPWCSLAGKVESAAGQFLVGLVCCAAEANSLGEVVVKHAAGWPDVIRVKG